MKKKTREFKEVRLPMEFNVALQKYEPVLPSPKTKGKIKNKEIKFKDAWQWVWVILIAVGVGLGFWLLMRKGLI